MGPLGELGALFNPGMRHETEEKLAKQMLREDEGTGRKGRLGIDLDSGVAIIGSSATAEGSQSDPPEQARPDTSVGTPAKPESDEDTKSEHAARTSSRPATRPASPTPGDAAPRPSSTPPRSGVPSGKARRRGAR